ncbi:MAG: hypothetical protein RDV48_10900 [Candidatus Eremiobacteraeota bacterium]|nr:hypothetical protein [Candidatus Eremiobacteraeota bacterium]
MRALRIFLITTIIVLAMAAAWCGAVESGKPEIAPALTEKELSGPSGEDDPTFIREYTDALLLETNGHREAGLYKLQLLAEKFPRSVKVYRKLAEMAINVDNRAYAIQMLQKVAQLSPGDAGVRQTLMEIYRSYQMPVLEILAARELLKLEPKNTRALERLAELYPAQGVTSLEIEMRERLKKLEPKDYQNLKSLAQAFVSESDLWEEVLVYRDITRRFPGKVNDLKRLAYLYGLNFDRYDQLLALKEVLRLQPGNTTIKKDFRNVYEAHRRDQGIRDYMYIGSLFPGSRLQGYAYKDELSTLYRRNYLFNIYPSLPAGVTYIHSNYDDMRDAGVNLGYEKVFLFGRGHVGVDAMYRNSWFAPKPLSGLEGQLNINSTYVGLNYELRNRWESNILYLQGGLVSVDCPDRLRALPGSGNTPENNAWLQQNNLGGSTPVWRADYFTRHAKGFWSDIYVDKDIVQDTGAFVRLMTKTGYGIGMAYIWPNGANLSAWGDFATLSDGNARQYGRVLFDYPLLSTGQIRDLKTAVRGYMRDLPDAGLDVIYQGDSINNNFISPYYESFQGEWQNRAKLAGVARLGKNVYFNAEGSYIWGKVLEYGREYRAGFLIVEPIPQNTLEAYYVTGFQKIRDNTQGSVFYSGDSWAEGFEVRLGWHF